MKQNKYEKNLIDNAKYLDTVTQSAGRIVDCANLIVDNNDKAAILLCKYIDKATGEEIVFVDNLLYVNCESASNKYIFGKFFFANKIITLDILK